MGLFRNKSNNKSGSALFDTIEPTANYDTVLEWLIGLSRAEYNKVLKVAEIHRKANQDAAAALGIANEPTTSINPPSDKPKLSDLPKNFILDDDDELAKAFLDDEPKKVKINKTEKPS